MYPFIGSSQFSPSGFSFNEENEIKNYFLKVAGSARGINRTEFLQVVLACKPHLRSHEGLSRFSDQIFSEIDLNRNGAINFNEFLGGFKRLLDSLNYLPQQHQQAYLRPQQAYYEPQQPQQSFYGFQQPQHSFNYQQPISNYGSNPQCNYSQFFRQIAGIDGCIDREEFARLLVLIHPNFINIPHREQISENLFRQIDQNQSGKINEKEFIDAYPSLRYR